MSSLLLAPTFIPHAAEKQWWNVFTIKGGQEPRRNRVVVLALQGYMGWRNGFLGIDSWATYKFKNSGSGILKKIYGGQESSRNRVVVLAHQATQAGGIGSLESIPAPFKSLKLRAQLACVHTLPLSLTFFSSCRAGRRLPILANGRGGEPTLTKGP